MNAWDKVCDLVNYAAKHNLNMPKKHLAFIDEVHAHLNPHNPEEELTDWRLNAINKLHKRYCEDIR